MKSWHCSCIYLPFLTSRRVGKIEKVQPPGRLEDDIGHEHRVMLPWSVLWGEGHQGMLVNPPAPHPRPPQPPVGSAAWASHHTELHARSWANKRRSPRLCDWDSCHHSCWPPRTLLGVGGRVPSFAKVAGAPVGRGDKKVTPPPQKAPDNRRERQLDASGSHEGAAPTA